MIVFQLVTFFILDSGFVHGQNADLVQRARALDQQVLPLSQIDRQKKQMCRDFSVSQRKRHDLAELNFDKTCQSLLFRKARYSETPEYLMKAGFVRRGMFFSSLEQDYSSSSGLSPQDHFATFYAKYFSEPDFFCQWPGLHEYFEKHFGPSSVGVPACAGYRFIHLIPFIQGIDFVHVHPGDTLESMFGHNMLRIVLCRPDEKGKCIRDAAMDIMMNFSFLYEDKIQIASTFTGQYKLEVLAESFLSSVADYTKEFHRSVYSYPLRLSRDEIRSLILNLEQRARHFDHPYVLTSTNCASEVLRLIQSALGPNHPLQKEMALLPSGVLDSLIFTGVVQTRNVERFEDQ